MCVFVVLLACFASIGCGVLYSSFRADRQSWKDRSLHLLLSAQGRISVSTSGTKSGKTALLNLIQQVLNSIVSLDCY